MEFSTGIFISSLVLINFLPPAIGAKVTTTTAEPKNATINRNEILNVTKPTTAAPSKYHKVCYKHVGCFSNEPPFDNANLVLPKSPQFINASFQLFTREDIATNGSAFLDYTDLDSLRNSSFDPNLPVKFVTHGFFNDIKTKWPYEIKDELLKNGDFNVITVAWGPGAAFPDYPQAVANTRVVAKEMEQLIDLMYELGVKHENIHLIGHSLGAHTSGQAGQNLRARGFVLGRITGLDPAEPDYQDHPKSVKLDKDDAAFVDVIHTNGAPFSQGGAGLFEPCGDVDFYVNGGKAQPDCPDPISGILGHLGDLFSGHTEAAGEAASCSHSRSHEVFLESINSDCPFTSYPCTGYVQFQSGDCLSCGEKGCGTLGYHSDWYTATGMMFLNTRMTKPFCGHHFAVKAQVSSDTKNTAGMLKVQLNGTWGVSEWLNITGKKNVDIPRGSKINSVEVSAGIIGHVKTVNVKYIRKSDGWLGMGNGQNQIKLSHISIMSGESGKNYLLCINSNLKTDQIFTFPATEQDKCV